MAGRGFLCVTKAEKKQKPKNAEKKGDKQILIRAPFSVRQKDKAKKPPDHQTNNERKADENAVPTYRHPDKPARLCDGPRLREKGSLV